MNNGAESRFIEKTLHDILVCPDYLGD